MATRFAPQGFESSPSGQSPFRLRAAPQSAGARRCSRRTEWTSGQQSTSRSRPGRRGRVLQLYAETRDSTLREELSRPAAYAACTIARPSVPGPVGAARRPDPGSASGPAQGARRFRPGAGRVVRGLRRADDPRRAPPPLPRPGRRLRLPRGLQERTMAVQEATSELSEELGRIPTPAEIAPRLGFSVEDVLEALEAGQARRTLSLDARPERPRGCRAAPRSSGGTSERLRPGRGRARRGPPTSTSASGAVLRMRFVDGLDPIEIGDRSASSRCRSRGSCGGRCGSS